MFSCSRPHNNNKKVILYCDPDSIEVIEGEPDESDFNILKTHQYGENCLALIKYNGCKTYNGRKLMLYLGVKEEDLRQAKILNPHFLEESESYVPFARFEPTEKGRDAAHLLAYKLQGKND
jgi:hypothetical protein